MLISFGDGPNHRNSKNHQDPRDMEGKTWPGTQIIVPLGSATSEAFTKGTTLETEGEKDSEKLGGRDQSLRK